MTEGRGSADATAVGRYAIFDAIGSGGMASVHLGRLLGPGGFARTVAIKRLHSELATDPDFVAMLLEEARLASRIRHPNVVSMLDVVHENQELFLVMEYIEGESLSRVLRAGSSGRLIPLPIVSSILSGVLQGLHAAHEATDEDGRPLEIVHRDVSPQNILLGIDGSARVADFGVAKAVGRAETTRDGQVKGKAGYMAPEQLCGRAVDRRVDTYAAAIVLWEMLTGRRLFLGETPAETMLKALEGAVEPPGRIARGVPHELDALVMRGLDRTPSTRFATALGMSADLERVVRPATVRETADWLKSVVGSELEERIRRRTRVESTPSGSAVRSIGSGVHPAGQQPAEPASQVSSISVTTPKVAKGKGFRGGWALGALAAIAFIIAASYHWGPSRSLGVKASPEATVPTLATSERTASLPEPGIDTNALPAASNAAPGAATALRTGIGDASAHGAPSHPGRHPGVKPRPVAPNCSPPFTIDPSGIHVAKPECL